MLRKMKPGERLKRTRKVPSAFETFPDWPKTKALLDSGLGESEGWLLTITDEMAEKYGLQHRRTVQRFLKKYIKSLGKRYTVKSVQGIGQMEYEIQNPVVVTKIRRRA